MLSVTETTNPAPKLNCFLTFILFCAVGGAIGYTFGIDQCNYAGVINYGEVNIEKCETMLAAFQCQTADYKEEVSGHIHTFSADTCATAKTGDYRLLVEGKWRASDCVGMQPGAVCQTDDFVSGSTGWKTSGMQTCIAEHGSSLGYEQGSTGQWGCHGMKEIHVSFETCDGFYHEEIKTCPTIYTNIGVIAGYISFAYSLFQGTYFIFSIAITTTHVGKKETKTEKQNTETKISPV